jgi:hypothetical protein
MSVALAVAVLASVLRSSWGVILTNPVVTVAVLAACLLVFLLVYVAKKGGDILR